MKDVLRVLCQTVLAEMRTNIYSLQRSQEQSIVWISSKFNLEYQRVSLGYLQEYGQVASYMNSSNWRLLGMLDSL